MVPPKSNIAQNRTQRKANRSNTAAHFSHSRPTRSGRIVRRRSTSDQARQNAHRPIRHQIPRVPVVGRRLNRSLAKAKTDKKVKAIVRGGFIAYALAWFYPVQLLFALLFILAWGAASMGGITGWLVSGVAETVMMLSWMLLIALGTGFMIYAALMFFFSRIQVWGHTSVLFMFAVCLAGYFAPLLFLFPWVFLWIAVVIWAQK